MGTQGIAPTLFVGRVTARHARPNDTWKESRLSSLHFGNPGRTQMSVTSTAGGVTQSVIFLMKKSILEMTLRRIVLLDVRQEQSWRVYETRCNSAFFPGPAHS